MAEQKGKIIVVGSVDMFNDEYFDKEENAKFFDFILKFFLSKEV